MLRIALIVNLLGLLAVPALKSSPQQPVKQKAAKAEETKAVPSSKSPTLRFDGLYAAKVKAPEAAEPMTSCLRFREDGNMNYVVSTSKPQDVARRWYTMSKGNPEARYQITGNKIEIVEAYGTHHEGMLIESRLQVVSQESQHLAGVYHFVPVQFVEVEPPKAALAQGPSRTGDKNRPPGSTVTKPESEAPVAPAPARFQGAWEGTTSQDQGITFAIEGDKVTRLRISYSLPSRGCFIVPVVSAATEWDWSTARLGPRTSATGFAVHNDRTSGGMHSAPIMHMYAEFRPDGTIRGGGSLTMIEMGPPLCQTMEYLTFEAHKVAEKSTKPD